MNICVIRNDKMGDMILTLPILKAIKEYNPHINIFVVCSKTNFFLCEEAPFIDQFYIFDRNDNFISKIKTIINLRKVSFDFIFHFCQSVETFLLLLLAKSTEKSSLIYFSRYGDPKFSKIFQRLATNLLSIDNIKINRNYFFKNKINFHQTEMMYQLVKKKLKITKPRSFHLLPNAEENKKIFEKRILVHLSDRWIDNVYSEENFLDLLQNLTKKYGKLYLTTDHSSNRNFRKIYQHYETYNDHSLYNLKKCKQNIIILEKLNFKNWRKAIISSKLVITYECGCVHIASMSNVPLLVVYDYKNVPYMIHKEYAPNFKNYQKVIKKQNLINQEIISKIRKMKINI